MNTDWPVCKLIDLADVRVSNVDKKFSKAEIPVRLCNYMDVYENDYVTESIDFMTASASQSEIDRFGLRAGDVVVTKDSETPDDIGVPAVVSEPVDGLVCGYHLALIRPSKDIDSIYLAKQLSTTPIVRYFGLNASGSTRFGLPVNVIENARIPVAPRTEQTRIAKILLTVDRAIDQTKALITKQKRIKIGLMQDLLTRGIDEHGNLRTGQIHKFKDSLSLFAVTENQEWQTTPLGEIADIVMGQSPDSSLYSEEEVGLPFLQGCAEFGRKFPRHKLFCGQSRKVARAGSILFSVRAPVGKLNIADQDYVIGRGLASISGRTVITEYLEHFLRSEEDGFRSASQGSTFEAINSNELAQWPIFHPTCRREQKKIAEAISTVDQSTEQTVALITKQQRLKTGLMQNLLTHNVSTRND